MSHFYDESEPGLSNVVADAMSLIREEARMTTAVLELPPASDNYLTMEKSGYGLFLQGNSPQAIEVLGRVAVYDAKYGWEQKMVDRATLVRGLLLQHREAEVREYLEGWRRHTLDALGIDSGSGF